MIQTIKQTCQNYYNQIPAGSLRAVCRSGLFSFTASLILFNSDPRAVNLIRPALAGTTAAVASSIHALIIPLFNYICGNHQSQWYKELFLTCSSLALAHVGLNYALPSCNINLITTLSPLDRFVILSSSLVKIILQLPSSCIHLMGVDVIVPELADSVRSKSEYIAQCLGINLNRISTPVYFTA